MAIVPAETNPSRPADLHGWIESGPNGKGRHRFVLFWLRKGAETLPPTRAQDFHAHVSDYPHVTWHPTEAAAQSAAWNS